MFELGGQSPRQGPKTTYPHFFSSDFGHFISEIEEKAKNKKVCKKFIYHVQVGGAVTLLEKVGGSAETPNPPVPAALGIIILT